MSVENKGEYNMIKIWVVARLKKIDGYREKHGLQHAGTGRCWERRDGSVEQDSVVELMKVAAAWLVYAAVPVVHCPSQDAFVDVPW